MEEEAAPYRLLLILESTQPGTSSHCKARLDGGHTWEMDDEAPILALNITPGDHHLDLAGGRGVERSVLLHVPEEQHVTRIFLRVSMNYIEYTVDAGSRPGTTRRRASAEETPRPAAAPAPQPTAPSRRVWRVLGVIAVLAVAVIAGTLLYRLLSGVPSSAAETAQPAATESAAETAAPSPEPDHPVGEAWTVPEQWSLTITGVRETQERVETSGQTPGAVYIVDYSYTNLGYEDPETNGLYLDLARGAVVDSEGKVGSVYPLAAASAPRETPVGATCDAQAAFAVENPGAFRLSFSARDGDGARQSAVFVLDVETGEDATETEE